MTAAGPSPSSPMVAPLLRNVAKVMVGKDEQVRLTVACLLAGGHVLFEDVPGVGKTVMARALAASIGGVVRRIQFTPDLLPSDVTGLSVYNQKTSEFDFKPGPIAANVVLADEINRANPRTQAALLEAMGERQVTVDGVTHRLEEPFFVMATQNPVEMHGTYALPEAQLDRFLMRLSLGYPSLSEEAEVVVRQAQGHPLDTLSSVCTLDDVRKMSQASRQVAVKPVLVRYMALLTAATRGRAELLLGASPRATLALYRCAQAWAFMSGREFGAPDDVKAVTRPVLAHRLILSGQGGTGERGVAEVVDRILDEVIIPAG